MLLMQETGIATRYASTRALSEELCVSLSAEDAVAQSMPDCSPAKWHLAHTTWFFETFVLPHLPGYDVHDPAYGYLFNSYYEAVGDRHPRPQRGLLTRPTLDEVYAYRAHVDSAMARALDLGLSEADWLTTLGTHHEQQHQELILTDIKHLLSCNPLLPAYRSSAGRQAATTATPREWCDFEGGLQWIGHDGDGFAFDNESPRHRCYLEPYRLASRAVTNGEFLAFIEGGGYHQPEHWLSAGWATAQEKGWRAPFYWRSRGTGWDEFTLFGLQPLNLAAPVCHVSYYEADAYARWAGARLPTEAEWEGAAAEVPLIGTFIESGSLQPRPATESGVRQLFGDVWEWTQSDYGAYPGFRPAAGAIGEYNGKFMSGQYVLRGGSCATPQSHIRATYRNFFPPDARWQFSGLRLAADR